MKKILQKEETVLRQIAKDVRVSEIKSLKIKKVLRELSASLKSQSDGVAIAAPQIGYSLRIFLVSGKIFEVEFSRKPKGYVEKESVLKKKTLKDLVFINPKISKLSKSKEWMPEGCLSVRPIYGQAYRSKKAIVTAYNEKGEKFERGGSGLLAQIFQHETDHLNGILFIDHAKELREESIQV